MRHLYKPIGWLLVAFFLLQVVVPVARDCATGVLQGEGCEWRPALSWFRAHGVIAVPLALALGGLFVVSRQADRRHQARGRFSLVGTADGLRPEDLGFHVVVPGEPEAEGLAQYQRPFHAGAYVRRAAVPYRLRGKEDPRPRYEEEGLAALLRENGGFVLQGPPTDGKSRTLYQVLKMMGGYKVVSPKAGEAPGADDIGLLLKGRDVVLMLGDLTDYVGAGVNLQELAESLDRNGVRSWAVAATCRDGPELETVRKAETAGLKAFYANIPNKLKLLELTAEDRTLLARDTGQGEWDLEEAKHYPTPGSITMKDYKKHMRARFDDLPDLQKDALRAVKLLARAGVLPFTHQRIEAVLEDGRLFGWRKEFHLRRDCLDGLRDHSFLRRRPAPGQVQPEPAYLADDVVAYDDAGDKEPEEDFAALMGVLGGLEDSAGLFYLGNSLLRLGRLGEALSTYDAALTAAPGLGEAFNNKGATLNELGRHGEALAASEAALAADPSYANALNNRGNALLGLGRHGEALAAYEAALAADPSDVKALNNRGYALRGLGRFEESLAASEAALELDPSYAKALVDKGNALNGLGRFEEALAASEAALAADPGLAEALVEGGGALRGLGRHGEALAAYEAALELDPSDAGALASRGYALLGLGRFEESLAASEAALAVHPSDADAVLNKALVLLTLERKDEAIEYLCRAWRTRERLRDGGASLAKLFTIAGKKPDECA